MGTVPHFLNSLMASIDSLQVTCLSLIHICGGEFIGCAALAVIWENLAEVRSLAIAKPWRGNGFGNILVDECCKDARRIGTVSYTHLGWGNDTPWDNSGLRALPCALLREG